MSFDKWASDLADHVRNRFDSMNPENVRRMFACKVCGEQCGSSPGYGQAVCEEHCEDHDYEYERDRRGHFCKHCDAPRPYDWGID